MRSEAVDGLEAKVAGTGEGGGAGAEAGSDVRLSWRNASRYEAIRIERNGTPIAEKPGGTTSYLDADLASGVYVYKVLGVDKGRTSFPASALLSTMAPPGAFLRGDASHNGKIEMDDAIITLGFLFLGWTAPACLDAADTNDDGKVELADAIFTLRYLFLGSAVPRAPGARYPWFDPTPDNLSCGE